MKTLANTIHYACIKSSTTPLSEGKHEDKTLYLTLYPN